MNPTFSDVVEEVKQLSFEEKQELESLIKKFIIEERREEIHTNYLKSREENSEGKLKSYTKTSSMLDDLNK